jgi:DDE family transposase
LSQQEKKRNSLVDRNNKPGRDRQIPKRAKESLAMILGNALPLGKPFFALLAMPAHDVLFLSRIILACVLPSRNLTAAFIAGVMRGCRRHHSNVTRFLRRLPPTIAQDWIYAVFGDWLLGEPITGTWLFILDQTYCGHKSEFMENSFSTAHRGKRQKHPPKDQRKKKKKQDQSYCHCFVFGLLITPSGVRLPVFLSYHTKEYCEQYGLTFRTQPQIAAQLITDLRLPEKAKLIVVGDAAFDAEDILEACARRKCMWIVPMNSDRRLVSQDRPRPQVMSLADGLTADQYVSVKLTPGKGPYVAQRRAAACRVGSNAKSRTFWVHSTQCNVNKVGTVRVIFSTMKAPSAGRPVKIQKTLMTNDLELSIEDIVELYDLRWQIELFFKEMKSVLGMADYRFRGFREVEGWVNGCVLAFMYLEWYRLQMIQQAQTPAEKERWQRQRSHGLALAVQQDVEWDDIQVMLDMCLTPQGIADLRELLCNALPKEYRKTG